MIGQTLSLFGVQKRYGTAWAVRDASLDIAAGEFVSIVGPSGSGKTTLLSMIAGFEAPSAGTLHVGQSDVTFMPANRRNIGMVFQRYALFPHMTVKANVEFPLRMRGLKGRSDAQSKVEAVLELVHLGALGQRYPHQLSGGQQQRVALARALVFDPPVILMDEPLGALDKKLRGAMQIEIKRMQERLGATVIYVTHDQEEALTMSDRVVVMRDGLIEQQGTPADLYRCPDTAFVADFIGTVNFVPACINAVNGQAVSLDLAGATPLVLPIENLRGKGLKAGSRCRLAVRPEHITLIPFDRMSDGDLTARLETVIFLGAHTTALLRLDDAASTIVSVQMDATTIDLPAKGDRMALRFAEHTPLLFPHDGEVAA